MHQVKGEPVESAATPAEATSAVDAANAQTNPLHRIRSLITQRPWLRRLLGAVLLITGTVFVVHALHGQLLDFTAATIAIPAWIYAGLVLLATLTVFITAALHAEFVASVAPNPTNPARVRYAYAASQVARYAPGKVFGVILEAEMLAPEVGLRMIIAATLLQTMLVYTWAATLACVVLGAITVQSFEMGLLIPALLILLWLGQRNRWLERLLAALGLRKLETSPRLVSTSSSRRSAMRVTPMLAVQWIPFFLMWLLIAGFSHGVLLACWLAASYLLASIGGSLLLFVPSGLVVREAAFVWLGGLYGLPAPSLVAWAIVIRLVLTFADVLAVPLLWFFQRKQVLK